MSHRHGIVAALVGLGLTLALAAGSRVPWSASSMEDSQLVLSWRGVAESTELCREPTEEDLVGLPSHMRPDRICEERMSEFRLSLSVDGVPLVDRVIRPAGARGDRPIYVLERVPVTPGPHQLEVAFAPTDAAAAGAESVDALGIRLERTVRFEAGHVVLVTRDGDRGEFVVRTSDDTGEPVG